ncbi:MAG: T9SS type A sorting domain-containing protein [Paludibacter sp.]
MTKLTKCFAIVAISLASVSAFAQPLTSAPTPPALSSGNVISIFSDAFTNVAATDFFPNWGQATTYTPTIIGASDHVLKYSNMNYQGVQFGSAQICSSMKYLHVDVWTNDANAATFPIGIIWTGNEKTVTKTVATNGTWTSLDIPLSEFTGAVLSSVIQFKFQSNEWLTLGAAGSPSKYTTVYLDNLYFWTDAAGDTTPPAAFTASAGAVTSTDAVLKLNATDNSGAVVYTITYGATVLTTSGASGVEKSYTVTDLTPSTAYNFSVVCKDAAGNAAANNPIVVPVTTGTAMPAAPTPTVAAANVKSLYSETYTSAVTITGYDSWWNMVISDFTYSAGGNAKKMVSTAAGSCGGPNFTGTPLDITNMSYLHIDVYPTSTLDIGLKLVTVAHGETPGFLSLGALTPNQWNSKDVLLTAYGIATLSDLKQVGFVTTGSFGTFYMDNLFLYNNVTGISKVSDVAVNCYPNPVMNKLNVSAQSEISEVTVRNILGQSVKSVAINSTSSSIDLSEVSAGNYYVSVKLANGQVSTQKFVKL